MFNTFYKLYTKNLATNYKTRQHRTQTHTQLYSTRTKLYTTLENCTKITQLFPTLNTFVHNKYTTLYNFHKTIQSFTKLFTTLHNFTTLYTTIHNFYKKTITQLHKTWHNLSKPRKTV